MKNALRRTALLFAFVILSSVCLPGCRISEGMKEATALADAYYAAMKDGDYEKAVSLYSDSFFERRTKEEWKESLAYIIEKLGSLESYKLTGWNVNYRAGIGASEVYTFTYAVEYANYDSTESLQIVRVSKGEPLRIAAQTIDSEGLLKKD